MKLTVKMKFEKATPNTFRFKAIDDDNAAKISTLYIHKSALTEPAQNITVTVEVENGNDPQV